MSKRRAWIPFHIGDLTVDTAALDESAFGIYMRLLVECYQRGGFKAETANVCLIAKCTPKRWRRSASKVLPYFAVDGTSWATHERVGEEVRRRAEISMKRTGAAMQMHMQMHRRKGASAYANDMQTSRARAFHKQIDNLSSFSELPNREESKRVAEKARVADNATTPNSPIPPPPANEDTDMANHHLIQPNNQVGRRPDDPHASLTPLDQHAARAKAAGLDPLRVRTVAEATNGAGAVSPHLDALVRQQNRERAAIPPDPDPVRQPYTAARPGSFPVSHELANSPLVQRAKAQAADEASGTTTSETEQERQQRWRSEGLID